MRVPVRQVSSEPTLLKYIGPFDQITIVVCLVPGKVGGDGTYAIYQECELYTM